MIQDVVYDETAFFKVKKIVIFFASNKYLSQIIKISAVIDKQNAKQTSPYVSSNKVPKI